MVSGKKTESHLSLPSFGKHPRLAQLPLCTERKELGGFVGTGWGCGCLAMARVVLHKCLAGHQPPRSEPAGDDQIGKGISPVSHGAAKLILSSLGSPGSHRASRSASGGIVIKGHFLFAQSWPPYILGGVSPEIMAWKEGRQVGGKATGSQSCIFLH